MDADRFLQVLHDAYGAPAERSSLRSAQVTIAPEFTNANNGTGGIRKAHAEAALRNCYAAETYNAGQIEYTLAAARIEVDPPFTIVLLCQAEVLDPQNLLVTQGWRVYGLDARTSPTKVYAQIVERYSAPFKVEGHSIDGFTAGALIPRPPGPPVQPRIEREPDEVSEFRLLGGFRVADSHYVLGWSLGIDLGRYAAAAASRRS